MLRLSALVLALSVSFVAPAAPASESAPAPPPVSAFFTNRAVSDAVLSPSGRYIAFVAKNADAVAVGVVDRDTQKTSQALLLHGSQFSINWAYWMSEDRILLGITVLKLRRVGDDPRGAIESYKYGRFMVAADRDGQQAVVMFRDDKRALRGAADYVNFVGLLPLDPDHVLAMAPNKEARSTVWKVDLRTGAAERVEEGDPHTTGWVTDSEGNLVIRYRRFSTSVQIEARAPGDKSWTEIRRVRDRDSRELSEFEVLGPGLRRGTVYVAVKPLKPNEGEARNLYLYDIAARTLSAPLWPDLKYDLDVVVRPNPAAEAAAVCYVADTERCDFKDKVAQANFRGLERFFGGERNIRPVSFSQDGRWWLLKVSGPQDPGSYYIYDTKAHEAEPVATSRPELLPEQLGKMERFEYRTRDGAAIPAYLTIPPHPGKGPLPLVVMPHGGPEARDSIDFDPASQVLASRGYMVMQPNFRGSGGYGLSYAQAGYGQWGLRMQDDVTDGVRALIRTGRVDPKRICIFGASYGGYAALYAGATTPELFRCVISMAGVADLEAMHRFERERGGGENSPRYRYLLTSVGDPSKDRTRLEQTSPINYAKTYQPPVLLFHGDVDTTVSVDQSKAMERALRAAGKDVRLKVFRGEAHGGWTEANMTEMFTELLAFLDAHIGPASAQAAAPSQPVPPHATQANAPAA